MTMKPTVRETAVFGMMAALMFASKKLMESLPNIHLVGIFIIALTAVYRWKALYPLYTYVLLEGLFGGFNTWWLPYLYVWTVLWGMAMFLPRQETKWMPVLYGIVCGLHGILFGVIYAPAQALIFGFNWKTMLAWIAAGFPFDCIHGLSNLVLGILLIQPLIHVIRRYGIC